MTKNDISWIDQIKISLTEKEYKKAFSIAKNLKANFTKDEKKIIIRALEMYNNETFYTQLGFNKEDQINKAIKILKEKI